MTRRWFFVPTRDRRGWDLVEAAKAAKGWELRRPGKFGARSVDQVPVPGEDWVEADPPTRAPKAPVVSVKRPATAPPASDGAPDAATPAPRKSPVRVVVKGSQAAQAKPRAAPERPDRKPGARHTKPVPKLSRELVDLLAQEQRDAPAPEGMVKCPLCGLALEPMKVRKVRTHDDPVQGQRCAASGQRLA